MRHTPFRRGLAAFLVAQPILWVNSTVYAQSLEQGGAAAALAVPPPAAPSEGDVARAERAAAAAGGVTVPAIDEKVDPDRYVCGPGDVLELNFWGVQNFRVRTVIDVEGRAFVAKVGYFSLAGKTLSEARQLMKAAVARFFPQLRFDVTLADPRTFLVQVADAVGRPGSVPARATERVAAAIDRAGGFAAGASRRRVEIRRSAGVVLTADLVLFQQTGDVAFNPYLQDGDVVRVPFEEVAVTISGAVNRPGRYELVKSHDLEELVELAGGLSPAATRLLPITLVRRSANDRADLSLMTFREGEALPNLALRSEDNVSVPGVGDLQQAVTVIGAIAGATPSVAATGPAGGRNAASAGLVPAPDEASATRRMPFVSGDSVRTLLDRVGGVGPLADLTGAYIVRGHQNIPVDLYTLVMLRDLRADQPITLGDTLVIPFKRRNVIVAGAVFAPGTYPYNPGFGVDQYLSLAGGLDRNAEEVNNVRLVTPNGDTKLYARNLKVEPGSALVVPERKYSRPEVVQMVLGFAGFLLSGVAVVIAARR